jgi:hypothetical protein
MMTLGAASQTDTVCISRKDAIRKLVQIENLKADSAELVLRKDEIKDLTALAEQRKISIVNLQAHVSTVELRMLNYKEQAEIWEKSLKKQKRKTILATVGGIGVTASLLFLLVAFK